MSKWPREVFDRTTPLPPVHPILAPAETPRIAALAKLSAVVLDWILADADRLVFDVESEEPVLVITLIERMVHDQDVQARKDFARYHAAAVFGGHYPRQLCLGCCEPDCRTGCDGASTAVNLPANVRVHLTEARAAVREGHRG